MTMKPSQKRLLLATLMTASAFAALAQTSTQTPPTDAAQPQMQNRMYMGDPAKIRERMEGRPSDDHQARREAHFAKRQAMLKAKLKITASQEGAWTTFSTAMKPPAMGAGGMGMRHDPKMQAEMDKLTTPERIDKMRAVRQTHMAAMNAEMDKRADATKAFYGVLSSEQKAVFDALAMHAGRHGEHGMHGGHRGEKGGHGSWFGGRGEHGRMSQPG
jgi:periplasmic protein CpxP/Spy